MQNPSILDYIRNQSVSTKLIVTLVALSIFTLLVSSYVISRIAQGQLESEVRESLTTLADVEALEIGSILSAQVDLVTANIISNPIILDELRTQNASYELTNINDIEASLIELDDEWRAESEAGLELIEATLNNPIGDQLRLFTQQFPDHAEVFITDRYGAEIAGSNLTSDYYQADEDWWQSGWNNGQGEISFSPPIFDESSNVIALEITLPIYDTENTDEVIGIIKTVYKISAIVDLIDTFKFSETGQSQLIDANGQYIAKSGAVELGEAVPQVFLLDGNIYNGQGFVSNIVSSDNNNSLILSYNTITTGGKVPEIDNLNWVVIVTQDVTEAFATISQAQLATAVITVFVAFIAIIVALWISRELTRPLSHLSDVAAKLSAGDYSVRSTVTQQDEFGELSNTFNTMASTLSSNIDALEGKIEEVDSINKQLRVAMAQTKEATRLKSEFLATMSHELRTPLNAITGFTGIMLFDEDELGEDNVHMLQRIESNTKRLLKLIDDVLDLSKIEAGRVEIVEELINVPRLAQEWVNETSVLAQSKNIPIQVEISENFPENIYGDSSRLAQVVKNLLSNAIKFTDSGHVKLMVSTVDNQWQIAVEDTGIGIPPHAQNYIFDEFRQVDGSSQRLYGGTGLGLAITRNIILMMNGTISVSSEIGEGSTFTVRLPIRLPETEQILSVN